jgi:hypothetical protein
MHKCALSLVYQAATSPPVSPIGSAAHPESEQGLVLGRRSLVVSGRGGKGVAEHVHLHHLEEKGK